MPSPPSTAVERALVASRYEILAFLGEGATGTVYRARDLLLDEVVALKVLRRELLDAPEALELFRREVKLSRRVTHRNVARVFDIGEHDGDRLLTMELVEGESLGAALARGGAFPLPRAVAVARSIAEGVAAAHRAGVVHRDLKPDNVLLETGGRVVVTDFGVARAVSGTAGAGVSLVGLSGTPAYMAPEQIEGRPDVDARADVYAFGAVLFEILTGRRAWPGPSPFVPARIVGPAPDPREAAPDLPPALSALVVRCLAPRREDRPADFDEVMREIDVLALAAAEGAAAPDPAPAEPVLPIASDQTIAVLPFHNGGPPDDAYLAEELTDDLIDALSMTPRLRVRAKSTLAQFRRVSPTEDAREIGVALGVSAVVEGSVRRAGGGVRMTVRLLGVADGFQLWAKRWDRTGQEVLAINDEAAQAIAGALGVAPREAVRAAPGDAAAVDLYLRARHESRKFFPDALRRSIALLEEALAQSPGDPTLLAGLAGALARLAFFEGERSLPRARIEAERAVAAAPDRGEPHLALGSVLFQLGDARGAVRALRAAVTHAPGLAEAQAALGRVFAEIGAVADAERRLDAALLLDPEVPLASGERVRICALLGRWDEVDAWFERPLPPEMILRRGIVASRFHLWRRRPHLDAAFAAELAKTEGPIAAGPRLVHAVNLHGRIPEGSPDLAALALTAPGVRGRLYLLQTTAEVHGFLHDRERTLSAVEAAAAAGLLDRLWLERCPLLDDVRDDPRYLAAHAVVARRTEEILAAYRAP